MRRAGKEQWTRIASLVLVAVVAALSLPLGASASTPRLDTAPATRIHDRQPHVEARPAPASRRPIVSREAAQRAAAIVVAALALLGLLRLVDPRRLALSPVLLAVQRGPPSLR